MRSILTLAAALTLGIAAACSPLTAQQAVKPPAPPPPGAPSDQPLRAGPVYTSDGSKNSIGPRYPEFDVVVPLDPSWSASANVPADWHEAEPGISNPSQAINVRRFEQTGYGVAVILALDVSGSMHGKTLDRIKHSVAKFVDDAQSQDRVAVMTFADESRWDVPFTASPREVRAGIDALATRGHQTRLYDAMLTAIDQFDDTMPRRRVLIVMSDGHDEGSQHTLEDVIAEANARKISINTIGVTRSDPKYLESLKTASQSTGGSYAAAKTDEELDQLISNGIDALKQTPVVTFRTFINFPRPETVPITITWKPQNVTALADMTTVVLPPDNSKRKWLYAGLGLAALLLAALLIFLLIRQRRRRSVVFDAPPLPETPLPVEPFSSPTSRQQPFVSHDLFPPAYPPSSPQIPYPQVPLNQVHYQQPSPEPPVASRQTRMAALFEAPQGQPFAILDAASGPIARTRVPVHRSPFTIGAAPGNTLRIEDDPTLSGSHARISLESSILMLDDLGSTNGTYINGVKIIGERRSLSPGDELRMGRSIFHILRNTDH